MANLMTVAACGALGYVIVKRNEKVRTTLREWLRRIEDAARQLNEVPNSGTQANEDESSRQTSGPAKAHGDALTDRVSAAAAGVEH